MKNIKYKEKFINGINKLTGIPIDTLTQYAEKNSICNIIEHPSIINPSPEQLETINLINEFIVSYNVLKAYEEQNRIKLATPEQSGAYFVPLLSGIKDKEKFMVAFLDNGSNVIHTSTIAEGTVSGINIYPRDIVKEALACDCSAIIIAHNHPGGTNHASNEDIKMTQKLCEIFEPLSIYVYDHIIVTGLSYISLSQQNLIQNKMEKRPNLNEMQLEALVKNALQSNVLEEEMEVYD
ncbi:JAB domain-containing protein [Anaeromicropila herbilytica]|uniref:MPN domain-containing protein n=1 Tax=Anaeromicropila herbilytica TaxID=2785025 RepID=A0A7R7IC65_9FIRM|nr:JAB domain-containing protein [Anaeromicropila herbilytica]BCN29541.1 hypothetical protein bsdtb5_08360 [Anaeromicropila herbilytica]